MTFTRADIDRTDAVNIADLAVERGFLLKRTGCELCGPCPICGGHDPFAINITDNLFNCRGCGGKGRGAIAFVRWLDGVGFRDAVEILIGRFTSAGKTRSPTTTSGCKTKAGFIALGNLAPDDQSKSRFISANKPLPAEYDRRQHDKARWLWSQGKSITGTIAETYLREARGITCPLPSTLAFLPPRKTKQHPAMIAAFGLCDEVEPGVITAPNDVTAVHLTLLKPDGTGKADTKPQKLFVGSPGSLPIVLAPPNDLLGLAITEGIEDALSSHQATGLGAWAAGAAGFMPKLADAVPDWIDCVTIYAHDDKAGRDGANALAAKLDQRGIEVLIEGLS